SSAATAAWRIERRSSSTRTVRSAAHGVTTRPRCRTSTNWFAPRRLCSARRRALPRGRRRGDLARRHRRTLAVPLGGCARTRRGVARRSPADPLPLLARRASARARARPVARSLHVPPRGEAADELLGLALRDPLLAAWSSARPRRGLERPPDPLLHP